jgi:hypothetical protein
VPIITPTELASYLERDLTENITLKATLANDIVAELVYPSGLPATIPTRIKTITLEVGARSVRNSNGYSSETIDDYTYRRPDGTREAGIYLTQSERDDLLAALGRPRINSIRLTSALTRVTEL